MGISIHYNGSLKSRNEIDKLRDELADISRDMGWDATFVEPTDEDKKTHPPIYGIIINLRNGCELFSFIFDNDGKLRNSIALSHFDYSDKYQIGACIKTQYSSPEQHIIIIKLLRYIKKVHIKDLQVVDEGGYWESSDKERLTYLFNFLNEKLAELCDILEGSKKDIEGIDNPEKLAVKLENLLRKHLGPDDSIDKINITDT
ncbi:MAG: hypothetical protein B6D64_09065 [Bacteroidetes bacterium 4484_276]|nr:MAG: hypothetical protein B6D64_09065 [Bacteroidetes bacterium 4484_276]